MSQPQTQTDTPGPANEKAKTLNVPKAIKALTDDMDLGMMPEGALLFLAHLSLRGGSIPSDLLEAARALRRSNAMVWSEITRGNYIGLSRALEFAGMGTVSAEDLQAACTRLRAPTTATAAPRK